MDQPWGVMTARPERVPLLHPLVGVGDALEREVLGVRRDATRARQLEHLCQLDDAAPVRVGQARVGRQRVEAVFQRAAGHADDHHGPALGDHLRVERERGVAAHAVEHERGAAPTGELSDLGRGVLAGADRVICTDVERERELGGVDIRGDHPGRGQRAQDLHGHVTEAADADDHRARARDELVERELDRVVGRQRGVGQRRRVAGIEIPERHEQPWVGDEHVLGHAAVAAEATAGRARAAPRARTGSPARSGTGGSVRSPTARRPRPPRRPPSPSRPARAPRSSRRSHARA